MKVLVIGGGGREHALVWGLSRSEKITDIYCCPGNAGISYLANCIDIDPNNFDELTAFAKAEWIDYTIVGPESPLCAGIVDAFKKAGLRIIGPNAKAAQLEGSKIFAKEFMRKYGIPTADYKVFNSHTHAKEYIRLKGAPLVIKADGLAAGKGVIVAQSQNEAIEAVNLMMVKKAFGNSGERIIIEECLKGEEVSFMVFTDGHTILPMPSSQDHKRVFDRDLGPNTGGMGAYSPAHIMTPKLERKIMDKVMYPTVAGLKREGIRYNGFLYAGLMIDGDRVNVLEFNCRFGDPETQPIIMRLDSDLLDILIAIHDQTLDTINIKWRHGSSVCVVIASDGYPARYETGKEITGSEGLNNENVMVFHSGTAFSNDMIVTSGGRVLSVTGYGRDVKTARDRAYDAVERINFDGMFYRKDIANKALNTV